jgi:hypothetical protein
MEHCNLYDMQPRVCHWTICVRWSQLWNYCGGQHGPVLLIHMVFIDKQVALFWALKLLYNSYWTIYITCIFSGREIRWSRWFQYIFLRLTSTSCTRISFACWSTFFSDASGHTVITSLMIMFTQLTTFQTLYMWENNFPKWIYNLTTSVELPPPNGTHTYFFWYWQFKWTTLALPKDKPNLVRWAFSMYWQMFLGL